MSKMASHANQIFVARLPKDVRVQELEDLFSKYGHITRCDVRSGSSGCYAFIAFEDKRDAQDAIDAQNGRDFAGGRIAVEWSTGMRREGPRGGYRGDDRGYGGRDYGRDRYDRDRRRSRSRSPRGRSDRRRASPTYSPDRKRRSPSSSRSRSRSRS